MFLKNRKTRNDFKGCVQESCSQKRHASPLTIRAARIVFGFRAGRSDFHATWIKRAAGPIGAGHEQIPTKP